MGHLAAVLGPGIVAILADTDAGSIVAASQGGAGRGDRPLWLQIVLVPIKDGKYMVPVSANIGAVIMPWLVFVQQSSRVSGCRRPMPGQKRGPVHGLSLVEKGMKAAEAETERSASPSASW